jgi:hypothetical protein
VRDAPAVVTQFKCPWAPPQPAWSDGTRVLPSERLVTECIIRGRHGAQGALAEGVSSIETLGGGRSGPDAKQAHPRGRDAPAHVTSQMPAGETAAGRLNTLIEMLGFLILVNF